MHSKRAVRRGYRNGKDGTRPDRCGSGRFQVCFRESAEPEGGIVSWVRWALSAGKQNRTG